MTVACCSDRPSDSSGDRPAPEPTDTGRAILVRLLATIGRASADARADRLLATFGSVAAVGRAPRSRLVALAGADAAELIEAHHAAMMWTLREPAVAAPMLATRCDLVDYLHHRMAHDAGEALRVFFLNGRRELIAEEIVAHGGPGGVEAEPRVVLARALELGATGLILVHNHPSGDPEPSVADRRFTRALATAAACLGIRLHDHLVVARDGHALVEVGSIEQDLRT